MALKHGLERARQSLAQAASEARKSAGEIVDRVKPSAEQAAGTLAVAADKGARYVAQHARDFLSTAHGKKVAKGAAAGAVLGIPVPLLGPITGALVGAAVGWWVGLKDAEVISQLEKRCRALTPSERQQEIAILEELYANGDLSEERYREGMKALTGH